MDCALLRKGLAGAVLFTGVLAADAGLIISPTSQVRETETLAEVVGEGGATDSDLESAPGFGSFNSAIDAQVAVGDPEDPVSAHAAATQISDIFAASVTARGAASAASSAAQPGLTPSAGGRSAFTVEFELDSPAAYTLSGMLNAAATNGGAPLAFVQFESTLAGTLYALSITDGSAPVLHGGVLPAGEYQLIALAEALADPSDKSATADFEISFQLVPEPGSALLSVAGMLLLRRR